MMKWSEKNRIEWKNVRLVPILHNRMEFAVEVRRQFEEFRPDHVAVEYPNTLKEKILKGVKRLPLLSVVHYEDSQGIFTFLILEPSDGQIEAIRLALSMDLPLHFIDRDTEAYPADPSPMPDPYSLTKIGHFDYCRAYFEIHRKDPHLRDDTLREKSMAYHIQALNRKGGRVLFVGGLYHLPGLMDELNQPQAQVIKAARKEGVGLAHLHTESSREVLSEMPFLSATYERARTEGGWEVLDRLKINSNLIDSALKNHWKNNKEFLSPGQIKVLYKFARNYALLTGGLVPSFYQLVVAARGAADDDFSYEVWEKGSEYPWQTDDPGLPVLKLTGEDLMLDQKKIRFHRRLKTLRRHLVKVPGTRKHRERRQGEWRESFRGFSICSYPPEDVVIEGYGRHLKKRAIEIKTEENSRIEPFTSSLMDGLDIRQTIRDWAVQGRIYVKEEKPLKGEVGSVVVIFDPDIPHPDREENFPWCVTWLGENDQESDMSFYSTPAGQVMDGPGISRCQYGGFMLAYPPMRVYDIWRDPFFEMARNKPERLLMAALDYSIEKNVVYVAATPPSDRCKSLASRMGKRIIYLPIGTFSPVTLKKIRTFHVLDGHPVRRYAHSFIRV